jgi:hypothetical protein
MDELEQEKMLSNIQQNTISLNNAFSSIAKYDVINTATVVNMNNLTNQNEINSFQTYKYNSVIEQPKLLNPISSPISQISTPLITSSPIQLDASNLNIQSTQYAQSSHYITTETNTNSLNFIINTQTSNDNPILNSSMNGVQQQQREQKLQQQTQQKKVNKKKTAQNSSDLDEERTSQLVSEILKNIKEKTKQLESMNQNIKNNNPINIDSSYSSAFTPKSSNKSSYMSVGDHLEDAKSFMSSSNTNSPASNSNDMLDDSNSMQFYHIDSQSSKPNSSKKTKLSNKSPRKSSTNSPKNVRKANKHKPMTIDEINRKSASLYIPPGWTRCIEEIDNAKMIVYTSPTGYRIFSLQDLRNYLLTPNTCKCGLECPLYIHESFCFDPFIDTPNNNTNSISTKSSFSCCNHKPKPLSMSNFDHSNSQKSNQQSNNLSMNETDNKIENDENCFNKINLDSYVSIYMNFFIFKKYITSNL